jgi:hypothetical protein
LATLHLDHATRPSELYAAPSSTPEPPIGSDAMTITDKIEEALKAVQRANAALNMGPTAPELVAAARSSLDALANSVNAMEREQRRRQWANVRIRDLTVTEKSEMVAAVGHREFARRLAAEAGP